MMKDDREFAGDGVRINEQLVIPASELQFRFAGTGGQGGNYPATTSRIAFGFFAAIASKTLAGP